VGTLSAAFAFAFSFQIGLFETDEMHAVLVEAELETTYDAEGLIGRGLFVGRRP